MLAFARGMSPARIATGPSRTVSDRSLRVPRRLRSTSAGLLRTPAEAMAKKISVDIGEAPKRIQAAETRPGQLAGNQETWLSHVVSQVSFLEVNSFRVGSLPWNFHVVAIECSSCLCQRRLPGPGCCR